MNRDFHIWLHDESEQVAKKYRTRVMIGEAAIHVDASVPGDADGMKRCVWIEISDGNVFVRTYDPEHEGPKTTVIFASHQEQHSDGYE